jgi:hypothetical protein
MSHGEKGHPEMEGYAHTRFEGLEDPHGEGMHLGHREEGEGQAPDEPPKDPPPA